jgi:hypothetical protein
MEKKKPSKNFQDKPRKEVKKRKSIKPGDILNMSYNGTRLSFIGDADRLAWNVMDRKERRNYVKQVQTAIEKKLFKPLEITYDGDNGLPHTIMIYVPYHYNGTGIELLDKTDHKDDTEKREGPLRAVK